MVVFIIRWSILGSPRSSHMFRAVLYIFIAINSQRRVHLKVSGGTVYIVIYASAQFDLDVSG